QTGHAEHGGGSAEPAGREPEEGHGEHEHGAHEQAGAEEPADALPAGANLMCPVMPDEAIDPNLFVEYQGKRIYVCCKKCLGRVAEDPGAWYAKAYGAD
ncbi:MAG: hypothetical protein ACYS8K_09330, partial [Planctomycetota bacterium]